MKIAAIPARAMLAAAMVLGPFVATTSSADAAELGITLVHARASSVELAVVCPPDPPTLALVSAGADDPQVIGTTPVVCVGNGVVQTVVVPLTSPLTPGTHVDLSATISGDSGEINASFPRVSVESDEAQAAAPHPPTRLQARAGSTKAVVHWRYVVGAVGVKADGFKISLGHRTRQTSAARRTAVFRHFEPGRRYTVKVSAFNAAGSSTWTSITIWTKRRPHHAG